MPSLALFQEFCSGRRCQNEYVWISPFAEYKWHRNRPPKSDWIRIKHLVRSPPHTSTGLLNFSRTWLKCLSYARLTQMLHKQIKCSFWALSVFPSVLWEGFLLKCFWKGLPWLHYSRLNYGSKELPGFVLQSVHFPWIRQFAKLATRSDEVRKVNSPPICRNKVQPAESCMVWHFL